MAVRARGGSGPGTMAALVVFVVLFFAATIFAIVYYVQARGMQQKLAANERELREVIRGDERSEVSALRAGRGQSVVGSLLEQRSWAFGAITGNPKSEFEAVQAAVKAAGLAEGQALVPEIGQLRAQLAAAGRQQEHQQQAIGEMATAVKQAEQNKGTQQVVFAKSVEELDGQVKEQRQQWETYEKQVEKNLGELRDTLTQDQRQYQQTVGDLEQRVTMLTSENTALKKKVNDLLPKSSSGGPVVDPSLLPDGNVVAVEPSGRWVYINRGRNQHLVLGMTFEVFSDMTEVAAADQARGKASVKVAEVLVDSAKCLVTRLGPGKSIAEGDLIVNAVYSPGATFSFFVFGDFDIDNRGEPNGQDARRIEEMIESWGGRVVKELTYDADFVVLGKQPPEPPPLTNQIDPVQIERAARQRQVYEEYERLVRQARELSVPILNQNRFLTLVGYYER